MMLLNILFPSWKFFDRAGPVATLSYQIINSDESKWIPCFTSEKRTFLHLVLNPKGNIYLSKQGLVDNLVTEINSMSNEAAGADAVTNTKSYRLIVRLIQFSLKERGTKAVNFRFKVSVKTEKEIYDAITSNEITL